MRKLVVHMQSTLDSRIATAAGGFWEPFPWGDEETAYLNDAFRAASSWVMGRRTFEAVVPWWTQVAAGAVPDDVPAVSAVDREFAHIFSGLEKLMISSTADGPGVLRGDVVAAIGALKAGPGRDIILSGGPDTVGPIIDAHLVDEYLVAIHPAVLTGGPRLFDGVTRDLALRLVGAKVFDAGAVVLRYANVS